jgi:hypothetical protein
MPARPVGSGVERSARCVRAAAFASALGAALALSVAAHAQSRPRLGAECRDTLAELCASAR